MTICRVPRVLLAVALAVVPGVSSPLGAQLTLRVSVPRTTPPDAAVYIAGSWNGWTPNGAADRLALDPSGRYSITLPDSVRGPVEFKLTLGSWDRAEADSSRGATPNRRVTIPPAGAITVDATVARWSTPGAAGPKASTRTASVTVMSDSFAMPQLERTRRVWIYLPPGYATSHRRYTVLYLQDGQNLFDAGTSFAGEWGVDETLDSLRAAGDPGIIVVGIDHGDGRRLTEYDPWKNADPRLGGGEGDAYVDFLVQTLKPYIDGHYRTRRDAASTGIGGSSAGALIALVATLRHPDVFGRAMLFSTASWLAGAPLYALARSASSHRPAPRLYFLSGAFETPSGEPARDQRRMVDTLLAGGYPRSAIRSLVRADGKHAEWFWRREFAAACQWLFPAAPARRIRER
jgi:predicted alpha/beta superfamily hydrolase